MSSDEQSVALTFFNDEEARTVEALAERIIPGDGQDPGATEAGVVYYIDRAVSGISADLQVPYRLGLHELDALCRDDHGHPFRDLGSDEQDAVVRRFLGPEVGQAPDGLQFSRSDQGVPAAGPDLSLVHRLVTIVREHTVEGFFCDPVYGGNRDAVGWKLVGFPGAHWGYTAEQMVPGFDGRAIPIKTLSDLRRELKDITAQDRSGGAGNARYWRNPPAGRPGHQEGLDRNEHHAAPDPAHHQHVHQEERSA